MRPSRSRRFAWSRRTRGFPAPPFVRFRSSKRCSIGTLLGIRRFLGFFVSMQCLLIDAQIGGLIVPLPRAVCRDFVFLLSLGVFSF